MSLLLIGRKARRIMVLALGLCFLSVAPSQAGVSGCAGAGWGMISQEVCIQVDTGGKNYNNRTQYVGSLQVFDPNQVAGTIDAWGDGFYFRDGSGSNYHRRWSVNRWVRSGTNICGRIADKWGSSKTACIAIRV
jgi:hypothetical protein